MRISDWSSDVCSSDLLQRLDRGQRSVDRVAIVGAAAAVQPVAAQHRLPRAEVVVPAGHFRLLVEVSVEQHAVVAGCGARGRNVDEDQRRAAFRSEEHTSELQSLMRISYAVFCLKN